MKTVEGIIEFNENEYSYTAHLDCYPETVEDLDRADGDGMTEEELENYEAIEEKALENARLLDWAERNGWSVEDSGGGCSAFVKSGKNNCVWRITKANDPSAPETFQDPVNIVKYNAKGLSVGSKIVNGGIAEYLKSC